MTLAYIGIGSNQGDRMTAIQTAIQYLHTLPNCTITAISPWYQSAAITLGDPQPDYINGVIAMETKCDAQSLLQHLHDIEARMGRPLPRAKWQPRPIDLDLLAYGDQISDTPGLQLPHPEILKRLFVLLPLHDIAPRWIHPVTRQDIATLLQSCPAQDCHRIQ